MQPVERIRESLLSASMSVGGKERIEKERERNRMRYQRRKAARYYDKPLTEPKITEKDGLVMRMKVG